MLRTRVHIYLEHAARALKSFIARPAAGLSIYICDEAQKQRTMAIIYSLMSNKIKINEVYSKELTRNKAENTTTKLQTTRATDTVS